MNRQRAIVALLGAVAILLALNLVLCHTHRPPL